MLAELGGILYSVLPGPQPAEKSGGAGGMFLFFPGEADFHIFRCTQLTPWKNDPAISCKLATVLIAHPTERGKRDDGICPVMLSRV